MSSAKSNGTAREYVVLLKDDSGFWREVGSSSKVTAEAAIKEAAGDATGTYVAVPKRSWNPLSVSVETQRIVRIGTSAPAPEEVPAA